MKTLFLLRHAHAEEITSGTGTATGLDFDRPLTAKGIADAGRTGTYLLRNKHMFDHVITSPAPRAFETTRIICEKINFDISKIKTDKVLYNCDKEDVLEIISSSNNNHNAILLTGHNPSITLFAASICSNTLASLGTCNIVAIRFDIDKWEEIERKGKLLFTFAPQAM